MRYYCSSSIILLLIVCGYSLSVQATETDDMVEFGRIRHGMTEAEVVQRLGPPAQVYVEPPTFLAVHNDRSVEFQRMSRYLFYYPGNTKVLALYIQFENGVVVGKRKGSQWNGDDLSGAPRGANLSNRVRIPAVVPAPPR